jgi:probable F420-dependent oxidoreductase
MIVAAIRGRTVAIGSVAMHLGALIFPTDETPSPVTLARMAEDRGFESIWYPEHTHIPASRETPYPAGGELPREYARTLDPFVALAAAASATSTIKLGTGICLVVEHDPIVLAKTVATLDQISGGRFLFGVGAGWNREEMRNHGTDPRTRMRLLAERIIAMKAIWSQDEASFDGEFVKFDRIWAWPKPLQRPHPPILVGGNGPTVHDRVLDFGDAWLPNLIGSDELIIGQIEQLRERAGRDVPVTLYAGSSKPERLARYAEAGIERVVFWVPQGDGAAVEHRLDQIVARATETGVR